MSRRKRPVEPEDAYEEASADDAADFEPVEEGPSKTQLKKEAHALQALGESMLELPDAQLAEVEMEDELRDALKTLRRLSNFGARRRQLQFVGKLLRSADPEPLRRAVEAWRLGLQAGARPFVEAEQWRARLLEDDHALTDWMAQHPEDPVQSLRQLIRNARREEAELRTDEPVPEGGRPHGRHYRALFRHVRTVMLKDADRGDAGDSPDDGHDAPDGDED